MPIKNQTLNRIQNAYSKLALSSSKRECDCETEPCEATTELLAKKVGYTASNLKIIPADANMGLSCGNPTAIDSLQPDDIVLDIGSGAGFDCFLAAHYVTKGRVIGVDISKKMVERATLIAQKRNIPNTEFKIGQMESLPIETASVNVVMSNCAINLTPYKSKVYGEIYRVLKNKGRIAISDICLKKTLPQSLTLLLKTQPCLQANLPVSEYEEILKKYNFKNIEITLNEIGHCITEDSNDPFGREIASIFKNKFNITDYLVSIQISATK